MTLTDSNGKTGNALMRFVWREDEDAANHNEVTDHAPFHEVMAFNIDRLMGLYRVPPTVSRCITNAEVTPSVDEEHSYSALFADRTNLWSLHAGRAVCWYL